MTTPISEQTTTVSPEDGGVRCSDTEREQTGAKLHTAAGEGRLSMDEVEERLAKTYAARYRHELDALTADLPAATPTATGWRLIAALTRQQLTDDIAALAGRGPTSRRRRILLALATLAVLLCLVGMVFLALHGITDGPEGDRFGRGEG